MPETVPVSRILPRLATEVMGFTPCDFQHGLDIAIRREPEATGYWHWCPLHTLNDAWPLLVAVKGDLTSTVAIAGIHAWSNHQQDIPSACRAIIMVVARAKSMISETDEIDFEK